MTPASRAAQLREMNQRAGATESATDPITFEVIRNALAAAADEMALIIMRSAYSPVVRDSMDYSTALCDADGQVVSESVLGDGIRHVLATSNGQVWIGYFDEGIYGNYGWGQANTDEPVGAAGIVRFSPRLAPAWHYPRYTEVGPWDAISDCYALNVDDMGAWACYDSDFPVVRIRDDAVTGWHNDITGASALAVAGSRVALFGGYGPDHDRLALTELSADRAQPAGQYRVVLPGGEPLPAGTQVIGRGSRLHFLTGTRWYQLGMDDLPA